MRQATRSWLEHAEQDFKAANLVLQDPALTQTVAFHAQQAVEKLLKGLLEESEQTVPRTHDLERLYVLVRDHWSLELNECMLRLVSSLYIDSRYPAEVGLLPSGRPTEADARKFLIFVDDVRDRVSALIAAKPEGKKGEQKPSGN